jgi:hypothetical protein
VNISRFLTRRLPLLFHGFRCNDGPMQGQKIVLTEYSRSTAWLEVNGQIGRYVANRDGRLQWEARR